MDKLPGFYPGLGGSNPPRGTSEESIIHLQFSPKEKLMNPQDIIKVALTPGSPLNPNGKIFRSVKALAGFANLGEEDVMDILLGDLAGEVQCKPSQDKGTLVALRANVVPAEQGEDIVAQVAGGPAFNPPQEQGAAGQPEVAVLIDPDAPVQVEVDQNENEDGPVDPQP